MKTSLLRKLKILHFLRLSFAQDDAIRLRVKCIQLAVVQIGLADSLTFSIIEKSSGRIAGEIALRIGEAPCLDYLGHIGYHIDPSYRGRHFAMRACALCRSFLKEVGMHSAVITTDEDNLPSIRTCEGLGCRFECTVDVPSWCVDEFQISNRKRRYIFDTA